MGRAYGGPPTTMGHTWRMLDDLALSRGTLDRMADLRSDAAWFSEVCADPSTFVVGVSAGSVVVDGTTLRNLRDLHVDPAEAAFIGAAQGQLFVALMRDGLADARSLREIGAGLSDDEAAVATTAVALHQWHRAHTHCPLCGAPTHNALAGWERRCPIDGSAHYPRTDPAVIVLITDAEDRLLLARQAAWPEHRFSLVAGFVEPGETAEQAVAREVFEEVGIRVGEPQFLRSQPWPFPSSLMLCFAAPALTTEIHVDGTEITEAQWLTRAALRDKIDDGTVVLGSRVSIARRAIEHWFGNPIGD